MGRVYITQGENMIVIQRDLPQASEEKTGGLSQKLHRSLKEDSSKSWLFSAVAQDLVCFIFQHCST